MSQFSKTRLRMKVIPSKPELNEGIACVSQTGLKFKSAVGFQLEVALFDYNETAAYDVDNITSVTHVIYTRAAWDAGTFSAPYLTRVHEGPFTNFTDAEWNAGSKQHFTIGFTATQAALEPGNYVMVFFGNTDDPDSPIDFAVAAELEVLKSGIPTAFVDPDTQDALLAELKKFVLAQMGDVIRPVNARGVTITLTSQNNQHTRVIGIDDDNNPIDNIN
jgi:hypothetical protein